MRLSEFADFFRLSAEQHYLWTHPYFTLVRERPTLALLQAWAVQAGMIDEIFAEILATMLVNKKISGFAHPEIQENLNDELGNGNPEEEHFQLFRGVLGALGILLRDYKAAPVLSGTEVILRGLRNAVEGDSIRALAIMASEELICPREFPILMDAINRLVSEESWRRYFDVHCFADVKHSMDLIRVLHKACGGHEKNIVRAFACQQEDLAWNCAFYDSLLLQTRSGGLFD